MLKVVTNNPKANQWYRECESDNICMVWRDGSLSDVLTAARDLVHGGWKLLNHPLSSSIKPNQTKYKTLLLVKTKLSLDYQSLVAIEASLAALVRFGPFPGASERALADLQMLDLELCKNIELPNWEE